MTIGQALKKAEALINKREKKSPALDAEILLSHIINKPKTHIFIYKDRELGQMQAKKFLASAKKRAKGVPVAYLTGKKEFFGLNFLTTKATIIPRPLTEVLVEKLLVELKNMHGLKILDIGTGTGNIIISLAKNLGPTNRYFGSDINNSALKTARKNAGLNSAKITFTRSNLLKTIKGNFDVIVANLPYLSSRRRLPAFEPRSALVAKKNGLADIENLFMQIGRLKNKPRLIGLEAGLSHRKKIISLQKKYSPESKLMLVLEK